MIRGIFNQIWLLRAPPAWPGMFLEMEHLPSPSLGYLNNLFHCFTHLIVKDFIFISSLYLPSFSSKPSPLLNQVQLNSTFPIWLCDPSHCISYFMVAKNVLSFYQTEMDYLKVLLSIFVVLFSIWCRKSVLVPQISSADQSMVLIMSGLWV